MNDFVIYSDLYKNDLLYNVHDDSQERYDYVIRFVEENTSIRSIIDISYFRGVLLYKLKKLNRDLMLYGTDLDFFNPISDVHFLKLDLKNTKDYEIFYDKRFDLLCCLDVLEHLHKKNLDDVFKLFTTISTRFCFNIANHSDKRNGVELHLIQESKQWWLDKLNEYFIVKKSFNLVNNLLYCFILEKK
jgi:hypothetical protein